MTNEEKRAIIELAKQIKFECQHEEVIHNKWSDEDGSVSCAICGKDLGWWCPDSPNHQCEYYGIHDYWPERGEFYNEDDCIYCHQPEERK